MANKSTTGGKKAQYASYKASNKQESNRKRKLERALKLHPNNTQIEVALKNIGYRRGTPKAAHWSHTSKHLAQLSKSFAKRISGQVIPDVSSKDMDKLFMRAHDGNGALVWNQA